MARGGVLGGLGAGGAQARPGPWGWARPWAAGTRSCGAVLRGRRPSRACCGSSAARSGGAASAGLGQRRGEDRGDLGAGHGRRRAEPGELLGAYGPGDPRPVQDAPLVGLGDQVLGLVVVAVGGLDGPQVDGDAVLLGGHHAGQQIAVAGDEDDVGAGAVAGQLGQLGVHRGVHALLRPAAVAAGQRAEPDGHPGHHAQPAVLGLRDAVGGAVEPVDAQQRPLGVGLGAFAQALDEGGVVDGDPGTGGLSGEEARGGAQQIPGVHQDDAAVHATPPSSREVCFGLPSSLPDRAEVNGRNSIFGVAVPGSPRSDNALLHAR